MLAYAGKDHIFEIIYGVLFGVDLLLVKGHGDVIKRLIYKQTNVQLETDGGKVGNHVQGFKGLTNFTPGGA